MLQFYDQFYNFCKIGCILTTKVTKIQPQGYKSYKTRKFILKKRDLKLSNKNNNASNSQSKIFNLLVDLNKQSEQNKQF
jgi:hypothetical protein